MMQRAVGKGKHLHVVIGTTISLLTYAIGRQQSHIFKGHARARSGVLDWTWSLTLNMYLHTTRGRGEMLWTDTDRQPSPRICTRLPIEEGYYRSGLIAVSAKRGGLHARISLRDDSNIMPTVAPDDSNEWTRADPIKIIALGLSAKYAIHCVSVNKLKKACLNWGRKRYWKIQIFMIIIPLV